jgi:hypothetical protein
MKSNSLEGSELMCIILEAKEYLQCWWNWFQNVMGECNSVAHELGQLARRNTYTATWLRQAPVCALGLLNDDYNVWLG